jgi:hypothetical protein
VISLATHAIKDRPSTWGSDLTPPPSFNISEYQEKLNKIGGFTQQGEPVLRLVWGGNDTKLVAIEFDSFGNPTEFGRMARHAFESKKLETWGELIPIRRWIIEENTDAGQLEALGGKNHGNIQYTEKGLYTPYIIIADHSTCKDCKANEFKCFGDYKAPGHEELLFLTEVTYKLTLSRKQDPRKGLDMGLAAQMIEAEKPNEEEELALEKEENVRWVKDYLKTHGNLTFYADSNSNKPADSV